MRIKKVGVVGAGAMGRGIAALAASAGVPVVLLDIPGKEKRNEPAQRGLEAAVKSKPASFMDPARASLVTIGNTEDDLELLADCDWVVEAIIEQLEPKQALFSRLEEILREDAIVSSNTSGIPMRLLTEGRGEGFRSRFLGTHFFNPVRYMHLLELIPTPETDPHVMQAITSFGDRLLGKGIVLAKDAPGFIANRLGVYGMVQVIRLMEEHDLTIDEVDALNGPLVGRPNSATFRTADISGLDILQHVTRGLSETTGEQLSLPAWVHDLVAKGNLGQKTGAGFYKKEGKQILTLDWKTGEYAPQQEVEIPGLKELSSRPLPERLAAVLDLPGRHGAFMRDLFALNSRYALERAPDLAYDIFSVDHALEWGYGVQMGPFRQMDAVGVERVRELLAGREEGELPRLLQQADQGFYRQQGDTSKYLTFEGVYEEVPVPLGTIALGRLRAAGAVLDQNDEAAVTDLGDGVLLLEFRSKMGTLSEGVIRMLRRATDLVEREGRPGLVIGHEDPRAFSAGANLVNALGAVQQGKWDDLEQGTRAFQEATMSLRALPFPVVAAPFGLTLGGGAEIVLHSDQVQAHAELYMGLVEAGVGLLPGGGGTKELLFRFTGDLAGYADADPFEAVRRAFGLIAMGTTSGSALEARRQGFLRDRDRITMNRARLLADAKSRVLDLAPDYVPPIPRTIDALGKRAIGNLRYGIWAMREAGQITDHEVQIANEIAYVLCGGDGAPRQVTEQDILDLEREAFLRLLGTEKTQERILYTLKTGKTLRN
jgi:3-hydroxyacyl-CoA dehydrogenase